MKASRFVIPALSIFMVLFLAQKSSAQYAYYYQWGLLPQNQVDMLIAESSGDRAFHHVIEMSAYNRPRDAEEYSGTLPESKYVADLLKSYGLEDVKIERFGKTNTWNGLKGTLHEISPAYNKLADYNDLPLLLVSGSESTNVEAQLVWAGDGSSRFLEGLDMEGKIALTSGSPGRVYAALSEKGALGLVSFYSPRPLVDPLMIPAGGMRQRGDTKPTFAFNLPPREGHLLRDRLVRGEEIIVKVEIESKTEELDIQVPTCFIKGSDPDAEEVIISAHIFEGYVKQGANDNISGSASILEVARVLQTMINDGRLERPKRSIRFIWVPEFSGTIPWVEKHKDLMRKTLCNINLDMVGLSLSKYKSYFVLHRTSYGNGHYVGDVLENYYRYVGETNKMNSVVSGSRFYKRIVSPTGTEDPFYYQIESASGGSDHMVFNDWGVQVPGVLLITWPDPFYHTSQDRPWACDPTQLKRSVFITAASAYSIASAEGQLTLNIAGEVFGNASRRMGHQYSRLVDMVTGAQDDQLQSILKRSFSDLHGTCLGEKIILKSILELEPSSTELRELIEEYAKALDALYQGQLKGLMASAAIRSKGSEKLPAPGKITKLEKEASGIFPMATSLVVELGYRAYSEPLGRAMEKGDFKGNNRVIRLAPDFGKLSDGEHSILDIKHIIDAQQEQETDLGMLLDLSKILIDAGLIELK